MKFDIYKEDVPVLLLLRPKKHLYAIAIVEEITMTVENFVQNALQGKIGHNKYDEMPELKVGKCKEKKEEDSKWKLHARAEL